MPGTSGVKGVGQLRLINGCVADEDAVAEEAEDGQQRVAEEAEQTSEVVGVRTKEDAVDDGKR